MVCKWFFISKIREMSLQRFSLHGEHTHTRQLWQFLYMKRSRPVSRVLSLLWTAVEPDLQTTNAQTRCAPHQSTGNAFIISTFSKDPRQLASFHPQLYNNATICFHIQHQNVTSPPNMLKYTIQCAKPGLCT